MHNLGRKFASKGLAVVLFCLFSFLLATPGFADNAIATHKTALVTMQTDLLKNRLVQAKSQLANLQRQEQNGYADLTPEQATKQLLDQAALDVAVAKSNLDSIDIEYSESTQTISRLENDIQEIENQLNVFTIFGLKVARAEVLNVNGLNTELSYYKNLLSIEKTRAGYLEKLDNMADTTLQLQKNKLSRVSTLLKTRTIVQLKQQQAASENVYQQQQSTLLQTLNGLYEKLNQAQAAKTKSPRAIADIQKEIFYANENLNYTYLQMLIVGYEDQLSQLKTTMSHSTSITLLNKNSDQLKLLSKQLDRVYDLLKNREHILERYKAFMEVNNAAPKIDMLDTNRLTKIANDYQVQMNSVNDLNQKLTAFRVTLDKALQFELSSRQGLPGLDFKAWFDLGAELWLVPTLAYQVVKNLASNISSSISNMSIWAGSLIFLLELAAIFLFRAASKFFADVVSGMAEHELGHINVRRLLVLVLKRNLLDIFLFGNLLLLFNLCKVPAQSASVMVDLALVWMFFKMVVTVARICLVETVHHRSGHDVRLYHRLKWSFIVGGCITAMTVFMHQLPVIYEVKDLFDRLFLLFLLVVSGFLLKSWEVVPALILSHIDEHRSYLRKTIRLFGLILPMIFLLNSAIGLFGYVNFVLTISWYESIFLVVLIGYLVVRGLSIDLMMYVSSILIQHVSNGWLWTEAFLKPLDKVIRIVLFLSAWCTLFMFYGWNQQSPILAKLIYLLQYPMLQVLNTNITPLNVVELVAIISFLFWAARWVREFTFRLLSSRTKDMGLRNSLAIFSQYATIVIGIFICLRVLGIDYKALTFVATGLAFGVGLGLRDLANNFASGFLLLIERPLRVGDIVSINNQEGEVTHIGGRAVTIRTWDHMEMLVPNSEIFSNSFINWTAKDHVVRSVATINISRHDDPREVQTIIHEVLADHKQVLNDPIPEVYLKEISDSLMEFEVRYYLNLRQVKSRNGLRSEVLLAISDAFVKHGVQPPYEHHEFHVKNTHSKDAVLLHDVIS